MSRHWHPVSSLSRNLQLASFATRNEGMFPYEIYYVLATDEEIERLDERISACINVFGRPINAAPSFDGVHYLKGNLEDWALVPAWQESQ